MSCNCLQDFGTLGGRLKKFPNFENPLDLTLEFIGISLVEWGIESPTVQLKSFAPFFGVWGGRVCVWYMSWGFWAAGWPIEKVP